MELILSQSSQDIIRQNIESGNFDTPEAIVEIGLQMVQEREAKFLALKRSINQAFETDIRYTDEEVAQAIENDPDDF